MMRWDGEILAAEGSFYMVSSIAGSSTELNGAVTASVSYVAEFELLKSARAPRSLAR